ncbi:hypothetical protein P171DRAFT_105222 [Karstenula rhodostoma CBS 690.94]|uniref:Uncharacterized protein n=1 Tax=Karstenula rhodostoma CBS 690.94 TaxID=1392251 RepID=A0A9P4PAZ9_9PLEO|nr:hypothetical protein P171DRAFT_105222 [Karstenula rhodostoma CBS 690.94]
MAQNELGSHGPQLNHTTFNTPTNAAPSMSSEDEMLADVDEPPDLQRTPRPSALELHGSFKGAFEKHAPRYQRQTSLLSTALHSNETSPVEEHADHVPRGMSCTSTWSNHSISTAELTSDGGITSPGTRTSTPSPPLPPVSSHNMLPVSTKPLGQPVTIVRYDGENTVPVLKDPPVPVVSENKVEAGLGRKRCITFACGGKQETKTEPQAAKTVPEPKQSEGPPKRPCTIKFACPTKISTDAPAKPRAIRAASPAPPPRPRNSSKASLKAHRGSDSTIRNPSPVSVRKPRISDRSRRLSSNSDLARTEAFRFHEFASSEEEVEEWTQESTCHRRPLTIKDTLVIENNLRQLGEEAEEEALDDEEEDDVLVDDDEMDEDEDEDEGVEDDDAEEKEEAEDSDAADVSSDEGFQTDNEEGFAVSDDDSDAGSDYNWWTPGRSTAATSIEHLDHIRPSSGRRSISESSVGSTESEHRFIPEIKIKRRKTRPVNIRVPSPELPDSTDFVCGTLDEDRPLEQAYLSALERRRQARHKKTPQDVDPTFPTSDPELDEEDEDSEPDHLASESDHFMLHGQMEAVNADFRGRRKPLPARRSPAQSPKRLRSPAPIKRTVHRSPPPRKLFGQSPKRMRSPAPARLKSPPPTRRGSSYLVESAKRTTMSIQFAGLAERPVPTMTSSMPRTPVTHKPPEIDYDDEDTPNEFPVRRAIDIKVGLERKRQRRKEQLYKKMQKQKCHKDKRPVPGKGAERMREVGLGLAAHKGKVAAAGFTFNAPHTPDQKDMHVLSV